MNATTITFQTSKKPPACQISRLQPARTSLLQRKCACGGAPGPSGECEECRRKRLQGKVTQPSTLNHQHSEVPPIVHEVLRSPGQPLDAETRAFMEPRFGHDFSRVRVHTDARAAESARAIHAEAYTLGHDVVLGAGRYSPQTGTGRRLLAHELAHVLQQQNSSTKEVPAMGRLSIGQLGDRFEREAEAAAESISGVAESTADYSNSHFRVQRQPSENDSDQVNQDTQGSEPATQIDIIDDLSAVPDDNENVQTLPDLSLGPLQIQRQRDIPPPPPPFPTGPQMAVEMDNTQLLWDLTCMDRRERGYFVLWDETTKKSSHGSVVRGEVWTTEKCTAGAELNLGTVPPDGRHIFTVGFFHTHPPAPPGCRKTKVGPSTKDEETAKQTGLPGFVRDTSTPTAKCADEPQGPFYFFGPTVRQKY